VLSGHLLSYSRSGGDEMKLDLLDPVTSSRLVMMSVSLPADSKWSAILAVCVISNSLSLTDPLANVFTLTCNDSHLLVFKVPPEI
jgi:hypothetical protein